MFAVLVDSKYWLAGILPFPERIPVVCLGLYVVRRRWGRSRYEAGNRVGYCFVNWLALLATLPEIVSYMYVWQALWLVRQYCTCMRCAYACIFFKEKGPVVSKDKSVGIVKHD